MDTNEARTRMRDIALEALQIVDALAASGSVPIRDRGVLRSLTTEARGLLADAGYPGEGVWRGLQRATIGMETGFDRDDPGFWRELAQDLRDAVETLDSLIAPRGREADVHIIG
jgi:hypothetical protein